MADSNKASHVVDSLALSGKGLAIVESVEAGERALDRYAKYVRVLTDYRFAQTQTELGERMTWEQPESISEMASRIRSAVGKKGQIIWPEAFGLAQKHYGKETWFGGTPREHTVFPFVTGSNGKPFFGSEGQEAHLNGKQFEGKPLVVADCGADLISLSLGLMDQGFPDASVEWKVSRAFINNGESDPAARLGALFRNVYGVNAGYAAGDPIGSYFVGASLESQK